MKVLTYLLLILATCAGISQFNIISNRMDSDLRDANPSKLEARVRMRCGRGGRCKAGMDHGDSSAIAGIQIKENCRG